MSSTNIEQVMPLKLAQALANPIFPALDSQLRAGRHIGIEELDQHAFLMDYQTFLEEFYARYNVELIRAPEGFFYLRPRSTTLIPRSVLSELDMMVGKLLCYLYLSPERLANEGIFTQQELYDELLTLADENKLLKLVNQRSTGSDLDRARLQEKMRASLADVRSGDDPREAQLRLIRDGEAMALDSVSATSEQDDIDSDASDSAEEEQA
ncbi:MAG: chromosome partition protein MukE [Pantoea sp.]|nr:chromosome partition protein MukE [Pantoea sp.]